MDKEEIVKLFYEVGYLKRLIRSGWVQAGIENPETIAEHSFRTAIIAFYIAKEEGLDPYKACVYALFHDLTEARIGDINKIQARYVNIDKKKVLEEYGELKDIFPLEIPEEYKTVIRDADLIELALTGLEYKSLGYPTDDWIKNAMDNIKTKTAKEIMEIAINIDPHEWWKDLKKKI